MKIHQRISLFFLLGAPIATACLERIDEGASRGLQNVEPSAGTGGRVTTPQGTGGTNTTPRGTGGSATPQGGGGSSAGTGGSSAGTGGSTTPEPDSGMDPGPGTDDDGEGDTPAIIETRPVVVYTKPDADLEEVETACEATTLQITRIFEKNCQKCHGGAAGQNLGNFTQIMDLEALSTLRSTAVADPAAPRDGGFVGMLFIAPGEPARSRIYQRVARGEMPPDMVTVGALHPPADDQTRPTASDLSVLHEYIAHCAEAPPDDPGGDEDGGADPDPGGDDGGADPVDDGGADPPDPAPRGR